jgi:hypothetical protein
MLQLLKRLLEPPKSVMLGRWHRKHSPAALDNWHARLHPEPGYPNAYREKPKPAVPKKERCSK